jgi:hypothetical protein
MNAKSVKRITSRSLFACVLTILVAITLSTSRVAQAGGSIGGCSVGTLQGLYVFDAHGWNIVSNIAGFAVPKAILQGIDFNGNGTFVSPFSTVSINGVITRGGAPGTYTVNEDCTGTVTFVVGVTYDAYVRPDGGQVWMMQTSGPNGTHSVFEGTATRVP